MSFSENWLALRDSFDATARNKYIEKIVLNYYQNKKHLYIADIGTGTGNNFFYYNAIFPADWLLVENNSHLVGECQERLEKAGFLLENSLYKRQEQVISLHLGEIISLPPHKIRDVDLIVANALFDLFSAEQFERFCTNISSYKIPLYATLNYKSMAFFPESPQDKKYIKLYEKHMERKQSFGHSMGKRCSVSMVDILQNVHYHIHTGNSYWDLDSITGAKMIDAILAFMDSSINELLPPAENKIFADWLQQKKNTLREKALSLRVSHTDIFAHHDTE